MSLTNPAAPPRDAPVTLGAWQFRPQQNELALAGRCYRLEPRMSQTLEALCETVGTAVGRERLMQRVWGHQHITDDTLSRVISRLRKILAHCPDHSVGIETLPRVGYRLVINGYDEKRRVGTRWRLPAIVIALGLAAAYFLLRPTATPPAAYDGTAFARITPLTSLPGREVDPSLSPDGSHVVFSWQREVGHPWHLHVRALGSENLLQLTDTGASDFNPDWSPDGRRIAFVRNREERCDIMLISPTGGPARRVAACDGNADPVAAWTPDARALVFVAPSDEAATGLDLLDLENGAVRAITRPAPTELLDSAPAVSPDGRWLAFTRWHAFGVGNVFVAPMDGEGKATQVTFDNLKVHGIAWEADNRHLVFASNRGGNYSLWRVAVDGGPPERLPVPGRAMSSPVLAAGMLAWEDWSTDSEILSVPLSGGEDTRVVASSTQWDWSPRLSPDGTRLAFSSDRSGAAEIWVQPVDAGTPLRLTGFGGPFTSNPAWSPDGERIAFDTSADGQFDIWIVYAGGGAPRRVTQSEAQDRFPSFSSDGRALYFGSNRSGDWEVWRIELESGTPERLTTGGGQVAQAFGDDWLYFSRSDVAGGLWRRSLSSGDPPELVTADVTAYHCNNWLLRDGSVFFTRWEEQARTTGLYRFDLASGATVRLRELRRFTYKSGIDFTRDGRVLFGSEVESEADLMLATVRPSG